MRVNKIMTVIFTVMFSIRIHAVCAGFDDSAVRSFIAVNRFRRQKRSVSTSVFLSLTQCSHVPVFLTGSLSLPAGLLGCNRFHGAAVNYSSILLEDGSGFLYVGAREAIYKMDATNITATNNTLSVSYDFESRLK